MLDDSEALALRTQRCRAEIDDRTAELLATTPGGEWPDGMPTCLWPELVIVGISPGASEAKNHATWTPKPMLGEDAHRNFAYPDGAGYWRKVTALARAHLGLWDPRISESEAAKLTAHLNTGTAREGRAKADTVEAEYIGWVARLLNGTFSPQAVIFLGYVGYSRTAAFRDAWAEASGLPIPWETPDEVIPLPGSRYAFRRWRCRNSEGRMVNVVLWPNHPSRAIPGHNWESTLEAYRNIAAQTDGDPERTEPR